MTAKVTGKVVIISIIFASCTKPISEGDELKFQQSLDSLSSALIDSAYKIADAECNEKIKAQLPAMVDSLLKLDQKK